MKIKINRFSDDVVVPTRAHYDDAGLDCYAPNEYVVAPHSRVLIPLGFGLDIPNGYMCSIRPRSSMNVRGIITPIGTIDAGYKGEIKCVLINTSDEPFVALKGSKICQIVFEPIAVVDLVENLDNLQKRGDGGFGSTGV